MKMLRTKLVALSVALSIAAWPAQAGLKEALNEMFIGNVTSPGAYESQTRGGFVGGSGMFRAPGRSVNLLAFDPPRLDAGCGGIDFFGGSFSFINADQLVALFRQIAANAVGVAFKRAIDLISPDLGKLMQDFQNKLQSLNQMAKNTCSIANSVVKFATDPGPAAKEIQDAGEKVRTASGAAIDLFKATIDFFTSPSKDVKEMVADGKCTDCGNVIWKALTDNEAEKQFGAADSDQIGARIIIMSLIGTEVFAAGATANDPPVGLAFTHSFGLTEFRKGKHGGTPLNALDCGGSTGRNQCLAPTLKPLDFDGAEGYVRTMLFGSPSGIDVSNGSIIDKITNCTGGSGNNVCAFTAVQKEFVAMAPAPVLSLMRNLQHTPAAMQSLAADMLEPIADLVTVSYGEAAIAAARQAQSGAKVKLTARFSARISELESELNMLRAQGALARERIMKQSDYAAAINKNNPSLWIGLQGRRGGAK